MTVTKIKGDEAICDSTNGARKNARYPIAELVVVSGLRDQALAPSNEPRTYHPCPAHVVTVEWPPRVTELSGAGCSDFFELETTIGPAGPR